MAKTVSLLSMPLVLIALAEARQSSTAFPRSFFGKTDPPSLKAQSMSTIATMTTAIVESAHDAKLTLAASYLDREAQVLQMNHQSSLQGAQEACQEQLAAKQKAILAESEALSKASTHLSALRIDNGHLREEGSVRQRKIKEIQSTVEEFTENVAALEDYVAKLVGGTNPHDMPELKVVLHELSEFDSAAHIGAKPSEHAVRKRPALPPMHHNVHRNASLSKALRERFAKEAAARRPKLALLQASSDFGGLHDLFGESSLFAASPAETEREATTSTKDYAGLVPDLLLGESSPLAENTVETQLKEMKDKLVDIASTSSRMQQSVVDKCSQAVAEGLKSTEGIKDQTEQTKAMHHKEETLKRRLTDARKHLVAAHTTMKHNLLAIERDALYLSDEIASPMIRNWAADMPDAAKDGAEDPDVSLLQVSSGAQGQSPSARFSRRHRRSHHEQQPESPARQPTLSQEGRYDNQEMPEPQEGGIRAPEGSGSSMHAVAAQLEELQARLSQVDMENKQELERAKYVYERKLAEKQQENRNLAASNQKIAEEIQSLAKARVTLRAQADQLRRDIPAWKSDLMSLTTNFTTALEVTHKALHSIDSRTKSREFKILEDLDREDQERRAQEVKRSKLEEIMAASARKNEAIQRSERYEDGQQPSWPPRAAAADADEEAADEEGAEGDAVDEGLESDDGDAASSPVFLQTSMLSKIRQAANSAKPNSLLQALDTGLTDLRAEQDNAKDALKRKFHSLLKLEDKRRKQMLQEKRELEARRAAARGLDAKLQAAIRSLVDLDQQLRTQVSSLRTYTQQLGIRALPVTTHSLLSVEAEVREPEVQEPSREHNPEAPEQASDPEAPEQSSEHPRLNVLQHSHVVHTPSAGKTAAPRDHAERSLGGADAAGSTHWLEWLTR